MQNNLDHNALKKVEMIVGFGRSSATPSPITLFDSSITSVECFCFLSKEWERNIFSLTKQAQQRMFFLQQ